MNKEFNQEMVNVYVKETYLSITCKAKGCHFYANYIFSKKQNGTLFGIKRDVECGGNKNHSLEAHVNNLNQNLESTMLKMLKTIDETPLVADESPEAKQLLVNYQLRDSFKVVKAKTAQSFFSYSALMLIEENKDLDSLDAMKAKLIGPLD